MTNNALLAFIMDAEQEQMGYTRVANGVAAYRKALHEAGVPRPLAAKLIENYHSVLWTAVFRSVVQPKEDESEAGDLG